MAASMSGNGTVRGRSGYRGAPYRASSRNGRRIGQTSAGGGGGSHGRPGAGHRPVAALKGRHGVRLAYATAGRGHPAIVLVHGWAGDRSYLAPQRDHLALNRLVVCLDLRGHGASEQPEPGPGAYEVETLCDDVLDVAAATGCGVPVVVGHSLGGLVALACAARKGAVAGAVMIDPAPILDERSKAILGRHADAIAADDDGAWRAAFVGRMLLPTDRVREQIIHGMTSQPPLVAAAAMRAISTFRGAAALRAVRVPLLSIASAIPTDEPAALQRACPTMTLGQTVGAGHFNQLEVPLQVNLMIERFLSINGL